MIATELRPRVTIAWQRSATFRQQCARIAQAGAVVLLRTATSVQIRRPAQSRIGVAADGVIVAHVLVRSGADTIEHIGHELEHLLERLDEVDLREKLLVHRSGVTASRVGYESDRAIDAGRRVAREVRESWGATWAVSAQSARRSAVGPRDRLNDHWLDQPRRP